MKIINDDLLYKELTQILEKVWPSNAGSFNLKINLTNLC